MTYHPFVRKNTLTNGVRASLILTNIESLVKYIRKFKLLINDLYAIIFLVQGGRNGYYGYF